MSAARPFDLVIFDLDGTLVDSAPDIVWSLNATLADAGLAPLPDETVKQFVGDGAGKLIERALAASGPAASSAPGAPELLSRFVAHYRDHVCVGSRLYPGMSALLAALDGTGARAAVITNKPHDLAVGLLARLGIETHLAAIIGDGDGYPRKPDPSAARAVMARLSVAAPRTIVVGDGLPDVGMAHAIPCPVAAVTWGYVPATRLAAESPSYLVDSADALERILVSAA